MASDFTEFLDMTAEELYEDWLDFTTTRDPLLQDRSVATFNSILAEAVASEFWIQSGSSNASREGRRDNRTGIGGYYERNSRMPGL
ncbi:MAG: hypothetical protein WBN94_13670 [Methanothrix sp.]